jgi:hypothetical protein
MGNIVGSKENAAKDAAGLDDFSCLEIQNSAVFNDAFVAEVYESLPNYEGTELSEVYELLNLTKFQLVIVSSVFIC